MEFTREGRARGGMGESRREGGNEREGERGRQRD